MTEIVLHDIDQVLVDRIKRVADTRGWTLPRTLLHLLEQGLHVYEGDGSVHFDNSENDVLEAALAARSEEHTSELQSLMRISYAVFCLKKKTFKHTDISFKHSIHNTT